MGELTQEKAIALLFVIAAVAIVIAGLVLIFNMKKAAKLFRDDNENDKDKKE